MTMAVKEKDASPYFAQPSHQSEQRVGTMNKEAHSSLTTPECEIHSNLIYTVG